MIRHSARERSAVATHPRLAGTILVAALAVAVAIPCAWFAWRALAAGGTAAEAPPSGLPLAAGSTDLLPEGLTEEKTLRVTIVATNPGIAAADEAGARTVGAAIWGVEIEVENLGGRDAYSPVWTARVAGGSEAHATIPRAASSPYAAGPLLAPNETRRGWLYFEVPAGQPVSELHVVTVPGSRGLTFEAR